MKDFNQGLIAYYWLSQNQSLVWTLKKPQHLKSAEFMGTRLLKMSKSQEQILGRKDTEERIES